MFSTIDRDVLIYLNQLALHEPVWRSLSQASATYLVGIILLIPVIVIALDRNKEDRFFGPRVIAQAVLAILLATAFGFVLEAIVGRLRPTLVLDGVTALRSLPGNTSFPSGHTLTVFAYATVFLLHRRYHDMGAIMLLLAFLVGIGRMMLGLHYPTDVLTGALIGILCAFIVVKLSPDLFKWLERSRHGHNVGEID